MSSLRSVSIDFYQNTNQNIVIQHDDDLGAGCHSATKTSIILSVRIVENFFWVMQAWSTNSTYRIYTIDAGDHDARLAKVVQSWQAACEDFSIFEDSLGLKACKGGHPQTLWGCRQSSVLSALWRQTFGSNQIVRTPCKLCQPALSWWFAGVICFSVLPLWWWWQWQPWYGKHSK